MDSVGAIFNGFGATHTVTVDLSGNYLTEDDVTTVLNSFQWSEAALTLDFSRNSVTVVPAHLLNGVSTGVSTYAAITLLLRENPITAVSGNAFASILPAYVREFTVDLSSPTAQFADLSDLNFDFSQVSWNPGSASALTINAANSSVDMALIQVLGNAWTAGGAPSTLSLNFNLSRNGYDTAPNPHHSFITHPLAIATSFSDTRPRSSCPSRDFALVTQLHSFS
jgi:hypothetical protein